MKDNHRHNKKDIESAPQRNKGNPFCGTAVTSHHLYFLRLVMCSVRKFFFVFSFVRLDFFLLMNRSFRKDIYFFDVSSMTPDSFLT